MKIRFQADADLDEDIVSGVVRRLPEIDFKTASQAGLSGLPDDEVLAIAARDNRIVVSHDWRTMPYHFARFATVRSSPGVIIVPRNLRIGKAIEELLTIWATSEAEEYVNSITRLPL
jgi:predicted nuclease of predicted toxin-antitoxin system